MIELRDYQKEAVEAVISALNEGVNRQVLALPTGSGKTILMAAIAKHFNKKTLLIAHREELIQQAVDKFRIFWPEVSIGVCKAERNEIDCQVVVGSIQSCYRPNRLASLKEQGFELMMIDECHHSIAESYQTVINGLEFGEGSTNKLLLGVTATPDRNGLGNIFEKITFGRSIATMIGSGYLSPVKGRRILTNFSFEKIKIKNGDFDLEALSEAVNIPERNEFIADKFKEHGSTRKGVAFCVDVQHCKDLSDAFNAAGIVSEPVYGNMPSIERKNVLESLKRGKIQVVTSCGILIEGFDEPTVDAIVMARPTRSRSLYTQCIGRGLRLWPGKEDCIVLDFTDRGNNLDSIMTLSTIIPEESVEEQEESEEKEKAEREEVDRTAKVDFLDSEDKEFDVLGTARFMWVSIGDNEWSLLDDLKNEIIMTPNGSGYSASLFFPDGTSKQIVSVSLPFEYCGGVCEDYARRHLKVALADTKATWLNDSLPTQGQRDYLKKQNKWDDTLSKAQATLKIREIICMKNKQHRLMASEPPTPAQVYFLKANSIDTKNMTKLQAMQTISKLKKKERVAG